MVKVLYLENEDELVTGTTAISEKDILVEKKVQKGLGKNKRKMLERVVIMQEGNKNV